MQYPGRLAEGWSETEETCRLQMLRWQQGSLYMLYWWRCRSTQRGSD